MPPPGGRLEKEVSKQKRRNETMMMQRACSLITMSLVITMAQTVVAQVISKTLPVPERGFVSSRPAETWEEGLISGNGTIGANVLSRPLKERIIFTHERLFLPQGPPMMPPDSSARLFEIRRLIDRGLYKQATQLAFDLSGQEGFMYPDPFVPAFDLTIQMDAEGELQRLRPVGGFPDRRGDGALGGRARRVRAPAVRLAQGRSGGPVDPRIAGRRGELPIGARTAAAKRQARCQASRTLRRKSSRNVWPTSWRASDESGLTYRNRFTKAYPGSIQALEAVARVVAVGGTRSAGDGGPWSSQGCRPGPDPDRHPNALRRSKSSQDG